MAEAIPDFNDSSKIGGAKVHRNPAEPQGDDVLVLDRAGLRESFRFLKEILILISIFSRTSRRWIIGKKRSRASRLSIN